MNPSRITASGSAGTHSWPPRERRALNLPLPMRVSTGESIERSAKLHSNWYSFIGPLALLNAIAGKM